MIMQGLSFDEVMANLRDAFDELDGNIIADIYNSVCCKKIHYIEDGAWELTGEDDTDEV
jgi:hypothetical protein